MVFLLPYSKENFKLLHDLGYRDEGVGRYSVHSSCDVIRIGTVQKFFLRDSRSELLDMSVEEITPELLMSIHLLNDTAARELLIASGYHVHDKATVHR